MSFDNLKNTLKEFQEDLNMVKPQLKEILELLRNQQFNNVIEAAAAKIITELKTAIHDCPCNKEILKVLTAEQSKGKEIITIKDENPTSGQQRYSYPNFCVGNEELGTGKNPNSLTWPFGIDKEKST